MHSQHSSRAKAIVCYCSLAADVFTAGVACNKARDHCTDALASCLLMFRALLPKVFACCMAAGQAPNCQQYLQVEAQLV